MLGKKRNQSVFLEGETSTAARVLEEKVSAPKSCTEEETDMHRLENLFREDYRKVNGSSAFHIDRKRRRKLQEKKQAGGHARDDHEQQQHQFTL